MQSKKLKTFPQLLSLMTLKVYFHNGYTDGMPLHSGLFEVSKYSGKINHAFACNNLVKLAETDFKGKFKKAVIYENLTGKKIYVNTEGKVSHPVGFKFDHDDNRNSRLTGIDYYDYNRNLRMFMEFTKETIEAHIYLNNRYRSYLAEKKFPNMADFYERYTDKLITSGLSPYQFEEEFFTNLKVA